MSNVAITGASGFVGSQLAERFERDGWSVTRFTRAGSEPSARAVPFHLGDEVSPDAFRSRSIDALVHCAYDFGPLTWTDIRHVNVEGSRRLITAARTAGVAKVVVLSTISAFPGCRSIYGRAKLEIEAVAFESGAMVVRPGLVYGDSDTPGGGMIGSLRRSARGRIVPLIEGGRPLQYTVHIDDLYRLLCMLCAGELQAPEKPIVAASPRGLSVRGIVTELARRQGTKPRFVTVPWQAVWLGLTAAELLGLQPAYRSDSVISLVYQDPNPDFASLSELGVTMRDLSAG